jgi:hypothetical protein
MESSIASLRPLSLGEILDQAVRLYRRNFVTFVGILALVYVPLMLIQTGLTYLSTAGIDPTPSSGDPFDVLTPTYWMGVVGLLGVALAQFVLVQGVATAAITRSVADNYLGQPVEISDAYKKVGSSWTRLLGALFLMGLLALGVLIAAIIPCVGWFIGPGAFFFLAVAVGPLIAPVVMIEKRGGGDALRRAWDLARRRFWWLLGFMFLLYLLAQIVITGPTLVVNFIATTMLGPSDPFNPNLVTTVVNAFIQLIGALLYLPLQLTASTLVYFDLRVRTEGFDLALLSLQVTGEQPSLETIHELPEQQPTGKAVEWSDVGNFAILTVVGGGIYFMFIAILAVIGVAFTTASGF